METKQITVREQDELKITQLKEQLNILKEEFEQIRGRYLFEYYKILKQIFDLRSKYIEGYSFSELGREKGIDMDRNQIRYIFGFMFMSNLTKERLEREELKPSTILTVLAQKKELREPENQDKLFNKYLNKEINMKQITSYNSTILMNMAKGEDKMAEENKFKLMTIYHLKQVITAIEQDGRFINNPDIKNSILVEYNKLGELLKNGE